MQTWNGSLRCSALATRGRTRGVVLAALAALALSLLAGASSAAAAPVDFSGPAYQILAPGEDGGLIPDVFSSDQGKLYDALTPHRGGVNEKLLNEDFLSEKFGVQGPVLRTETTGRAGLEILRDSHDIAHVFGETRSDVMFGSGWIAAEDRGLLLALGLGPAYAAALSVPGISPFGLLLENRSFTPSAETVKFVAEQTKSLLEEGAKGEQVIEDLEQWADGINAYESSIPPAQRLLPPVSLTDAIAGFAFIGSIFGNGGGNEVADSELLKALEEHLGESEGVKVFRDLREVNDSEAPVTTTTPFPYDGVPSGPTPGALVVDHGSISPFARRAAASTLSSRKKMSNWQLIAAKRTEEKHALMVGGPQLGYFYPEIVMQADLHGGGIDAQGIIAPISPYVFIGRGRDYAWSLTSAGSENTQQFLEKLCNENKTPPTRASESYEYKGECIPMKTVDAGKLGASKSEPAHEVFFKETVHGPVSGTVTVEGEPYAIANDRSTRGREPAGEVAFSDLDSNQAQSVPQFYAIANELETTFNMSYLDNEHIAFFSTGRLPIPAAGTDPSLPTLGTGEYDWKGFLGQEQHPHAVDPESGLLLNWNNKPAPGWGASSDNFSYGAVQRVQMYTGYKSQTDEPRAEGINNRAATQDLRALQVWPVIEKVLAGEPAPSALAQQATELVTAWSKKGASRLGLNRPNAPAAAVLDAIWSPIAEEVLAPVLGGVLPELKRNASVDDPPSSHGSAFDGGWYGYVSKDLRSELGLPVSSPFSRQYCGNGSLSTCRKALWAVIQEKVEQLAAAQGSEPKKWRAAAVRITFPPDPLFGFTMRWTNRSTFQQVIEFVGHE
jgi:acyl-homoserine lactone acylase PvdQ